ncbi:conserved hypothetical protein [Sporisorium reilianum SRZ2]|uniref:chorismate mutase n=1 Tax=Sporisorium reilianum (strain SRZ2) TaxID=999809 RepID=E6ZQT8_SPORE|nr:conserved hypothetical protein [Sporisorium reilianum SRZ2]
MKITSCLSVFVLAAVALVHGVESAPTDNAPVDPGVQAGESLDSLRIQVQRYESPIVHTFLARAALGGSVVSETTKTISVLKSTLFQPAFAQSDAQLADWLGQGHGGEVFDASTSFPPGSGYVLPVVLDKDAVLDKPVTGKGIFPVGRRPQDPVNIAAFFSTLWPQLKQDPSLDPAATAGLDAALYNLVSARVLLGYEIGLAKFELQKEEFCNILTSTTDDKVLKQKITDALVDNKQQVNVLSRVQHKAKAYSKLFLNDAAYPDLARQGVLRLFQAYLIPVTTAIEAQVVSEQGQQCEGYKAPAPKP